MNPQLAQRDIQDIRFLHRNPSMCILTCQHIVIKNWRLFRQKEPFGQVPHRWHKTVICKLYARKEWAMCWKKYVDLIMKGSWKPTVPTQPQMKMSAASLHESICQSHLFPVNLWQGGWLGNSILSWGKRNNRLLWPQMRLPVAYLYEKWFWNSLFPIKRHAQTIQKHGGGGNSR